MTLLIGLDEAGYGPNLGPLVIAATVWRVPDAPDRFDPWSAFEGIVSATADPQGRTIQIADSKAVHSSSAGIGAVERSATALLRLAGNSSESLYALWDGLTQGDRRRDCGEPWYSDHDISLPIATHPADAFAMVDRWSQRCEAIGCRLVTVACDVVPASCFNDGLSRTGSKGRLLSEATLQLLRRVWSPIDGGSALVCCDKHGGRNRYADLLADVFPEELPIGLEESGFRSRYRIGPGEVRFQARSEEHLPVAAASLVAKYVREACMEAFNRFWALRRPDVKPTRGYPLDARRFLSQIEADASSLGLKRETYWRLK